MKPTERYDSLFRYLSELYGFAGGEWLRFKAQVAAESNFNPEAVSSVGAKGLAQFMSPTWKEWGKGRDIYNPEANIDAQIRYMKWLLDRVTNWDCAYAAYNWGIGNILRVWQDPYWKAKLPLETKNYLVHIDKFYEEYKHGS